MHSDKGRRVRDGLWGPGRGEVRKLSGSVGKLERGLTNWEWGNQR